LAIIFFSFGVLQTESKAGVVCLFIVLSVQFYSILKSKQKKVNWFLGIGVLLFSLVFVINNPIKTRFETMLSALGNIQTKNNSSVESNTARILMWNASWQVWKKDLILGVGTGDYNDELIDYNKSNKNLGVAKEELNAHNQFLNTSVQLGLLGLIVLVMIFISTFSYSQKSIWQVLILTVFFINFLVESFLETQAGVVLFSTLLLLLFKNNKTDQFELDAT
jgi:O-antigen ligase